MTPRRQLPLLTAVVCLAACGGSGHGTPALQSNDLPRLLLQPKDVPAQLERIDDRKQWPAELRGSATRHGRTGGWIARFKRAGGPATIGPLVIESRADTFGDDAGASADFADQSRGLLRSAEKAGREIHVPRVGDQSSALTVVEPGLRPVRFYSVVWRQRNAVASVTVEGWDGNVSARAAWSLARRQAQHIAAASS